MDSGLGRGPAATQSHRCVDLNRMLSRACGGPRGAVDLAPIRLDSRRFRDVGGATVSARIRKAAARLGLVSRDRHADQFADAERHAGRREIPQELTAARALSPCLPPLRCSGLEQENIQR